MLTLSSVKDGNPSVKMNIQTMKPQLLTKVGIKALLDKVA